MVQQCPSKKHDRLQYDKKWIGLFNLNVQIPVKQTMNATENYELEYRKWAKHANKPNLRSKEIKWMETIN